MSTAPVYNEHPHHCHFVLRFFTAVWVKIKVHSLTAMVYGMVSMAILVTAPARAFFAKSPKLSKANDAIDRIDSILSSNLSTSVLEGAPYSSSNISQHDRRDRRNRRNRRSRHAAKRNEGLVFFLNSTELIRTDITSLPNWHVENYAEVIYIFHKICLRNITLAKQNPSKLPIGTLGEWKRLCAQVKQYKGQPSQVAMSFFVKNFTPFAVVGKVDGGNKREVSGLFTGYYVPAIRGSLHRTSTYNTPVYGRPKDLKPGKKHYTRKQISDGALDGKGLELFWTDDPVALYFLQVQGSGIVQFDDGSLRKVLYDSKNGWPYTSIGKYAIKNKLTAGGGYRQLEEYLKSGGTKAKDLFNVNKSYVFFRLQSENTPVTGAHGSELFPKRSIAVDPAVIPLGSPMWIVTEDGNFSSCMFSQDTGSAIKGKVRADIFYGAHGDSAELAKKTYTNGWYYMLIYNPMIKYLNASPVKDGSHQY